MVQTLTPTNRKETATAENVDFGKAALTSTSPFQGRTDIEYLPPFTEENLKNITSMTDYFNGCTALKKIVLPKGNNTITNLIRTFASCSNLESITLPDKLDKIDNISNMLSGCRKLQSIVIPNTPSCAYHTALVENCTSLKTAQIGDVVRDTKFRYSFYSCTALESVTFGDLSSITNDDAFHMAFYNCKNLKNFSVKKLPMINFVLNDRFIDMSQLTPQSYANIFAALPHNTGNSELTIYLNATSLNAAKATTGKYTATDVYDTTTKKEQSKSLTINDWITAATNKGWIINS